MNMKSLGKLGLLMVMVVCVSHAAAQNSRQSSSMNLVISDRHDTDVPFSLAGPGKKLPVRWGLDVAWINEQNVRKGINHIGKNNLYVVRGSFQTTEPLINDTMLTDNQINTLRERMRIARIVSDTINIILNEDQEQGIVSYYGSKGASNTAHWAALINSSVHWIQKNYPRNKVIAVSPFNEPDYTDWGQGSKANFKEIARKLKEEYPRFADIAITAGNTLNNDKAMEWYNAVKPYVTWGNTHQLAGSFDNYASFFRQVRGDGNHGYADELHNVGEAMIGAENGMQTGIWWGFDSRARGEFCQLSNTGQRIGYAENRSAWSAACVYRDDSQQRVRAFLGTSERQATPSSFMFLSRDREVYYDGFGPVREYRMAMPGGTGYQTGQTNAERVINIDYGEDVPLKPINGRYKLMSNSTNYVVGTYGDLWGNPRIAQVNDNGGEQLLWDVTPTDPSVQGDFSFYFIRNAKDGKRINVLDNSTASNANLIAYNAEDASNEQWYLEYAGNGAYYIRNRESGLYLTLTTTAKTEGAPIQQATLKTGAANLRTQQWRFLPADVTCERVAPGIPKNLRAMPQAAAVQLFWDANTDADLEGYVVQRKESDGTEWNVIARGLKDPYYFDNTCRQGVEYDYRVRAYDRASNLSRVSEVVSCSPTGAHGLIAQWQFDDDLNDATPNWFDCIHSATPAYSTTHQSGEKSLVMNGTNAYLRLPYAIADMEQMTIALWVNWQAPSKAWQRIFDFGNGENEYMFLTPSNGSVMRFAIKNGAAEQNVSCTSKLANSTWKHVAVTIAPGKTTIYVDGEEAGSSTGITIKPSDIRPALNYIGRSQFNADPLFTGYIDDLRIYNYALSQQEVKGAMQQLANGIQSVTPTSVQEIGGTYYTLDGRRISNPSRGLFIYKDTKGKTEKVWR